MKISFVVPAHNEEALLGRTLDAITKATEDAPCETEIIVVDNASTDATGNIAHAHKGVQVVEEPRKGLTHARQAGLASTGDIIANVDADTLVSKRWLAQVIDEFSRNPRLVGLSGPYIYYDVPRYLSVIAWTLFYMPGYTLHLINQHILRAGAMMQGGNYVVRRSAMEKIGGFDTSIEFFGEDTDTAKRLSKIGLVKWSFKFSAHSSGRRIKKEGLFLTSWHYATNYLSTLYANRQVHQTHKDIRPH